MSHRPYAEKESLTPKPGLIETLRLRTRKKSYANLSCLLLYSKANQGRSFSVFLEASEALPCENEIYKMVAELAASHRSNNTFQKHCSLRQVCKFLFDRIQGILTSCKVHDGNSFSEFCQSVRVTETKSINFLGREA